MTTMHTPGPLFPRKNSAGMWELYTGKYDYSPSTAFITRTDDVGEADAHLYAAAPDLLAACKRLLIEVRWEAARADVVTDEARADIALAEAAIAKATGAAA